jgi:hypothetical protein
LSWRMLLKIAYMLTRRLLGLAVLASRGNQAKDAELLVLRHENAVLRRHTGRIRYEPADRVWFTSLARLIPCAARKFDCVANLCLRQQPRGGGGWLAGCCSRSSTC